MRFTRLVLKRWRAFEDIELTIPRDSKLVCLVGENGTGKSSIFELIGVLANKFGLTPGVSAPRGNPLVEPHDIQAEFVFDLNPAALLGADFASANDLMDWNGEITLVSRRESNGQHFEQIAIKGRPASHAVVERIRSLPEVTYLNLDADRSYPQVGIDISRVTQLLFNQSGAEQALQELKGMSSQRSANMYTGWENSVVARRQQFARAFYERTSAALRNNERPPDFHESESAFRAAVSIVLPHLQFLGIAANNSSLEFDSNGVPLRFTYLSGGEREIAFIVGQIDRFGLRNGLLMIDEPELHLNPDLVRRWVSFLRDNVEKGQVWIATHSMEAVEAAGPEATFVLQRDPASRKVRECFTLASRPVVATLSAALGTPGFSLQQLTFAYIEGEPHTSEAQRFARITRNSPELRYVSAGNAREVVRKSNSLKEFAVQTGQTLEIRAVVDRDFRSVSECEGLANRGAFVLPFHEIENAFLHPETLERIMHANRVPGCADDLIRSAADALAGIWITDHALYAIDFDEELTREFRELRGAASWEQISMEKFAFASELSRFIGRSEFRSALDHSLGEYENVRLSSDLWKRAAGKETLGRIKSRLGYTTVAALESAAVSVWDSFGEPYEVTELRRYLARQN